MNNSISVYQAFGEYRSQSNKKFYGHSSAGYAIQPGFSPDGKYIMSGSSDGQLYFWDWKSSKMYRNFKAHDGVCMGSLWHPSAPSKVVSWGWDGDIKLWE
jgi:pre-mRNA-processing factor 17